MSTNDRNQRTIKTIGFTHCPPLAGMETVNNILTTALNALTKGNIELAEKDFTRAVSACLHEFGEVKTASPVYGLLVHDFTETIVGRWSQPRL